jgi:hypothetical protein
MIYRSKVDWWLALIVAFGGIMLLAAGMNSLLTKGLDHPATWALVFTFIFYAAVVFMLAFPVSYEITSSVLHIRSGALKYRISLSSIEGVYPTRNPLSAPAWSLDRLHIDYRKKGKKTYALISPEDKESFLRELVQKTSGLEKRGHKVIRI